MRLKDILQEAPLPDDWEGDIFNPRTSFAKRVRYATERAKKLGTGSSRVAFEIKYKGRDTVLKIAKNAKGHAQNEVEAGMLSDWYAQSIGILIPMIDYDERSSKPTWIHMEKAAKIKPNDFKKFFDGFSLSEAIKMVRFMVGKELGLPRPDAETMERWEEIYSDNEYLNGIGELVGNFDIPIIDFGHKANWGLYKGEPVIIDIGFNDEVMKTYYS